MFVTSAAASQMVDRLVQAGVVERVEDESDRRAKRLCLTPRGARVLDDFGRERQAWIVALAKRLSPEESEIVQSALRIVVEKTKTMSKEKTEE
jgi:DNA-binding MarR family transcriptional regulator